MSPWEFLGLRDDADAASVRRRYAELLKRQRPEDDPQGFQRLRTAYESALAVARRRPPPPSESGPDPAMAHAARAESTLGAATPAALQPGGTDMPAGRPVVADPVVDVPAAGASAPPDPTAAEPVAAINPATDPGPSAPTAPDDAAAGSTSRIVGVVPPVPERPDVERIGALLDELFATCAAAEAPKAAVDAWWSAQPELVSIDAQSLAELLLLARLATSRGIPAGVAQALIDRFDWTDPWTARWLAGLHPHAGHWLAALRPYLLRKEFIRHLQTGPFLTKNPQALDQERRDLESLSRPLPSRREAFVRNLLNDSTCQRMAKLARFYTEVHGPEAAAACLDAEQVAFWTDLADRRRGATLRLLHSAVYGACGVLIGALILSMSLLPSGWLPNKDPDGPLKFLLVGAAGIGISLLYVLVDLGHWSRARLAPVRDRFWDVLAAAAVPRAVASAFGGFRDRLRDRLDALRRRHPYASGVGIVGSVIIAAAADLDVGTPLLLWFSVAALLLARFGYKGMLSYVAAHAAVRIWVPGAAAPATAVVLPTVLALFLLGSTFALAHAVVVPERDKPVTTVKEWRATLFVAVLALFGSWYANRH